MQGRFRYRAVQACCAQEYRDFDVYILDDSADPAERARIDSICRAAGPRVKIRRRSNPQAFKAGNINAVLPGLYSQYKYIAVVDADDILPPAFLPTLVGVMESNGNLGFAQGAHVHYGTTIFARLAGHGRRSHWGYFLPARNEGGFVHFYGHGALLRLSAIKEIGGFPETVSEDIALATEMRLLGYSRKVY